MGSLSHAGGATFAGRSSVLHGPQPPGTSSNTGRNGYALTSSCLLCEFSFFWIQLSFTDAALLPRLRADLTPQRSNSSQV